MTRIERTDTTPDIIYKMAGGNPGAMTVCRDILCEGSRIDPDGAMGGLDALLSLDTHGIYGHRIWMLYREVCGENLSKMLAIDRSCQLGILSINELNHAIDNYGDGIDVDDLMCQVKDRLPAFVIDVPNSK